MLKVTTPMGLTWVVVELRDGTMLSFPTTKTGAPITAKKRKVDGPAAEVLTGLRMPAAMDRLRELVQEAR